MLLLVLLALLAASMHSPPVRARQQQPDARCFDETGLCIAGRIREFWEQNGGLPVFGLPITPQRVEEIEGRARQVQWFERNRLELHPENVPPFDVLLGRLGADALALQGRDWRAFPRAGAPRNGCRYFPSTGHNVCGALLTFWRANGLEQDGQAGISEAESLALFGLPLSPLQTETIEGQTLQVQWFERARMELHPDNPPASLVQLGLLGSEIRPAPDQVRIEPIIGNRPGPLAGPDQRRVAFASNRSGNNDIYSMNGDGENLRKLTDHPANDTDPAWSPDGSRLVFVSDRSGSPELYLLDPPAAPDASGAGAVQQLTSDGLPKSQPAWSPDGTQLAYVAEQDELTTIAVIDTQGRPRFDLRAAAGNNDAPAWSPDGTQIAFASDRAGEDWEIFVMQADGSSQSRLTESVEDDRDPAWSPDGTQLVFASNRTGDWEIFVMQADGSNQRNLSNSPDDDGQPAWSPDGSEIAFHSLSFFEFQEPNFELYAIGPDGRGRRNLSSHPADDMLPAWSPVLP